MSAERLARALGVWSDGPAVDLVGLARKHGAALIKVMDSDGFRVWTPTSRTGLDQHWRLYVDPPMGGSVETAAPCAPSRGALPGVFAYGAGVNNHHQLVSFQQGGGDGSTG